MNNIKPTQSLGQGAQFESNNRLCKRHRRVDRRCRNNVSATEARRPRQRRERAALQVYMLLLDLNGHYFWIASNELRGEPSSAEMAAKARSIAMQIADKLREADDIQHLQEILTVLMSEDAYKTANDRARALSAVIDGLGETVNPRYAKIVRNISEDNVRGFMDRPSGHRNNAPALMNQ